MAWNNFLNIFGQDSPELQDYSKMTPLERLKLALLSQKSSSLRGFLSQPTSPITPEIYRMPLSSQPEAGLKGIAPVQEPWWDFFKKRGQEMEKSQGEQLYQNTPVKWIKIEGPQTGIRWMNLLSGMSIGGPQAVGQTEKGKPIFAVPNEGIFTEDEKGDLVPYYPRSHGFCQVSSRKEPKPWISTRDYSRMEVDEGSAKKMADARLRGYLPVEEIQVLDPYYGLTKLGGR